MLRCRADFRCEQSADWRHQRERPRHRTVDQAPRAGASHGRSHLPPPVVIETPSEKAKTGNAMEKLIITVACDSRTSYPVSYTHLRAHETRHDIVCRLLLDKKKKT